jgi:uncharacterized membrane protein YfcA
MPFALPPDLSWISLLFIVVAVTLAYLVFGATGFGSSVISVPSLAHVLPLTFVVPLITGVDCFAAVTANTRQWRQVDWPEFRRLFVPSVFGIAVGSTLLVNMPRNAALFALGAFTVAFAVHTLYGARQWLAIRTAWAIPAGFIGGIFSALFGTGGPLYMAYLASRIEDKTALRATSSMIIASAVVLRAMMFAGTSLWLQPGMLMMIALLVPCMLLGYFVGSHLHLRLSGASIRRWIAWLLLANGVLLILRAAGVIA